ncbi:hypothetical protein [Rhodobacteraceae phage LS06-2018-MD06]|jgi:hypothetical protein|nr:hypothetical protein [Rhodobacteraceae phage LS06-2018-MD06]
MTIKFNDKYVAIPSSGVLAAQYEQLSSYLGDTMAANNNGNIKYSKGPVIACGSFCHTDGTNANTSLEEGFEDDGVNAYGYRIRGRAFIPKPYNSIGYAMTAAGDNGYGSVYFWLSDTQWNDKYEDGNRRDGNWIYRNINVLATNDLTDTANSRYTGSINNVPISSDRIIYYYIMVNFIDTVVGSICMYAKMAEE